MEYRRLGKSGLKLSALSLGSWLTFGQQIEDEMAERLMITAYENGVNFFDNAEGYASGKSEIVMGSILKKLQWPRDTWCVSSKVFWGGEKPTQLGLSRKHIVEACHAALKRLQVDYLDLFFCHRPDLDTPVEETVAAMSDLIRQGKVLYWGTSEWSARDIMAAHAAAAKHGHYAPVMEQPQYNMFVRKNMESDYRRIFTDYGLGTTTWSPLACGKLTGKYLDGIPEDSRMAMEGIGWLRDMVIAEGFEAEMAEVRQLMKLAEELELSMPRLAIAWCLANPDVSTVIMGASKTSQLEENLHAVEDYKRLTPEILRSIDAILGNKPGAA